MRIMLLAIASIILFNQHHVSAQLCDPGPTPGNSLGNRTRIVDLNNPCDCDDIYNLNWTLHLVDSDQPGLRLSNNSLYGLCPGDIHGDLFIAWHTAAVPGGFPQLVHSNIQQLSDLCLVADETANNLILSTRKPGSRIIFATTLAASDVEQATITALGHLGVGTSNPKEILQLWNKTTIHVGTFDDFLGYNAYVQGPLDQNPNQWSRIVGDYASMLRFSKDGSVRLGLGGIGSANGALDFEEVASSGRYRGLSMNYESNGNGIFSFGRYWPMPDTRFAIRSFGNTSSTNAFLVQNKDETQMLKVSDQGYTMIGSGNPLERLQVGNLITFHDGGSKFIGMNAYYDPTVSKIKNIEGGRISVLMGISDGATSPDVYFIKVDENASQGEVLTSFKGLSILSTGNAGIGTMTPSARLHVKGAGSSSATASFAISNSNNSTLVQVNDNGFMGIGTNSPATELHVLGDVTIGELKNSASAPGFNNRLSVDGIIFARELKITALNWPDYVFEPEHNLMSIEDLRQFIKDHSRLPDVPSEAEVKKSGIAVGEMQEIMMRKIEELTLYVIELSKRNQDLKSELDEMKQGLEK
ncbi:MAG: hypothetical protein HYX66_03755 [Ignavibacteria bacterium]|nr:hypothetical protein [Ignavibacteria bacterium]